MINESRIAVRATQERMKNKNKKKNKHLNYFEFNIFFYIFAI